MSRLLVRKERTRGHWGDQLRSFAPSPVCSFHSLPNHCTCLVNCPSPLETAGSLFRCSPPFVTCSAYLHYCLSLFPRYPTATDRPSHLASSSGHPPRVSLLPNGHQPPTIRPTSQSCCVSHKTAVHISLLSSPSQALPMKFRQVTTRQRTHSSKVLPTSPQIHLTFFIPLLASS